MDPYASQPHFLRFSPHTIPSPNKNNLINNDLSQLKKKKIRKWGNRRFRGPDAHYKTNVPEARCAYFHRTKEEWRARYVEDTKRKMKCFSLKRYKNEHALTLAECFLSEMQRTHKVPHDEDINMWYEYILKMGSKPDFKSETDKDNSDQPTLNLERDEGASEVIGLLIRAQRSHTWIAEGSIAHVPQVGPWGESQHSREGKKRQIPTTVSPTESHPTLPTLISNESFSPLRYLSKTTHVHDYNTTLRHRHNRIDSDKFDSPNVVNIIKHEKKNLEQDTRKDDESFFNDQLQKPQFSTRKFSNIKYYRRNIFEPTDHHYLNLEPNLDVTSKSSTLHLPPQKFKPRQAIKPRTSNGIRLPRSPSLPPDQEDFEEIQNNEFLLSQFTDNSLYSVDVKAEKKHTYKSLPSLITRCAKSRRKFWDMRYSDDVNYKDTGFDQLNSQPPRGSFDKNDNLDAKMASVAKYFDSFEPPQHLLTSSSKLIKTEQESTGESLNPLSSITTLEQNSLQTPIINFELLSQQNRYSKHSFPIYSSGNCTDETLNQANLVKHMNTNIFSSNPTHHQNNQLNKQSAQLFINHEKSPTVLEYSQEPNKSTKVSRDTPEKLNDTIDEKIIKTDTLFSPSDTAQETKKFEENDEAASFMKLCAPLYGLANLTNSLSSDMSEKEIEYFLIEQLSKPEFPITEIDLERLINLSQMNEHNSITTGKLKYLRTLDEQLGKTLIEEENLHVALYFYRKIKYMKPNEIEMLEKSLEENCNTSLKTSLIEKVSSLEKDVSQNEEIDNGNSTHSFPTNDLEELFNLESLHIFSEALMDEKQRILDTLFYHIDVQLQKLNRCIPHILDGYLSNILKGDCYIPHNEISNINDDQSISHSKIKDTQLQ